MTKTTMRIMLPAAGALGGYASFKLVQAARRYCGPYELDEALINWDRVLEPSPPSPSELSWA